MSDLDTVFNDELPEGHRSGVVAVVGRPNVGKSTLINAILGQKIAIVTPRPQTTRRQQLGIYTTQNAQILFVDTPGLHKPQHKLGEFMVQTAESALKDADVILWVLDASEDPQVSDRHIAETLGRLRGGAPLMLVLNKLDMLENLSPPEREARINAHRALIAHDKVYLLSALKDEGVRELADDLTSLMPEGPRYYPADQLSEVNMRFIAAEVVREKVMLLTDQEVPHAIAVEVEEFKERSANMSYISATIYVERESQKGIIIGKNGAMIKQIGSDAREELRRILDSDVYLELHVKVMKNWRSDETFMKRLGYRVPGEKDER